jgi:hypothetical protein
MNAIDENFAQIHSNMPCPHTMTHFYVYQNLNFVSDLQFEKNQITIGRSKQADLFLDHQSVADIHALVNVKGKQVILTNRFPQNGLRLNGLPVRKAPLKHKDVIAIGPFSLRIKMRERQPQPSVGEDVSYAVRLVNRYNSPEALNTATANLARMLHADAEKIRPLVAKSHFVVKKGLNGLEAAQIQNTMLKAGVVCDVQLEEHHSTFPDSKNFLSDTSPLPSHIDKDDDKSIYETMNDEEPQQLTPVAWNEDEEEEDEEIWDAPFSLNQKLSQSLITKDKKDTNFLLQVVKTMGDAVVDAVSLNKGQKYNIQVDGKQFCLANYQNENEMVSIPASFGGVVLDSSGVITADLNSYKTNTYQRHSDQSIYEIPLPEMGSIVVDGGGCQYRIDRVQSFVSPHVEVVPAPKDLLWQHWALSFGVHFLLVTALMIYAYLQIAVPDKPKLHFVKIDRSMLQQLEAPKKKPEAKPEPKKPVKIVKPSQKKPPLKRQHRQSKPPRNPKKGKTLPELHRIVNIPMPVAVSAREILKIGISIKPAY